MNRFILKVPKAIEFSQLANGEAFLLGDGRIHMKCFNFEYVNGAARLHANSINLENGKFRLMTSDSQIRPVNLEVIVTQGDSHA